jgi:hypothetical protein
MNFAIRMPFIPYFRNAFSVWRTQESGSSDTLHRRLRIRRPRRRPGWNQIASAMSAAATQHAMAGRPASRPPRINAPAASSSGIDGSGMALCSTRTHEKSSAYPCFSTNAIV